MKTAFAMVACALTSANVAAASIPECFLGRWKSDEALTLQDMHQHHDVTETARRLFENGLFGKLVLVIGRNYNGAYFQDQPDVPVSPFEANDIAESGLDWVTLRSQLLGTVQEQRWFCEQGRIYTLVTKWQFKEYFSPLP